MKRFLSAIAAGFASFATCIAAQAADLPTEPVYKAPIVASVICPVVPDEPVRRVL
jgi:hypothetical protein